MHPSHLFQRTPYLQYQRVIETYGDIHVNLSKKYLSDKLSSAKWLYSKNLVGHTGCVNALAFSSNGGEFLASGMILPVHNLSVYRTVILHTLL